MVVVSSLDGQGKEEALFDLFAVGGLSKYNYGPHKK
jgi:hypothetical protein